MSETLRNYIDGKWVEAKATRTEAVYNPATGEVIAHVPLSGAEDVEQAVKAAQVAFGTWKEVAIPRRARILFKYQQLLVEHWDELARLITKENGKKISRKLTAKCSAGSNVWSLLQAHRLSQWASSSLLLRRILSQVCIATRSGSLAGLRRLTSR